MIDSAGSATSQGDVSWGKTLTATLGGTASDNNMGNFASTPETAMSYVFGPHTNQIDSTSATTNQTDSTGANTSTSNASSDTDQSVGSQLKADSPGATAAGLPAKSGSSGITGTLNNVSNVNANYSAFASWRISKGHVIDFTASPAPLLDN